MIRRSIAEQPPIFLLPKERRKCTCIASFVMTQCLIVFVAASTVLHCTWYPGRISFDPYKLASIMYLYDKKACGFTELSVIKALANLKLSNDTRGFNVLPIRWMPATVPSTTRLSKKTRTYIKTSIIIHSIWMVLTIAFILIVRQNNNPRLLNWGIKVYFCTFIFVLSFDLSMAIVYITHIKRSLTKGMIVRNSGWSVELKLKSSDDFSGYLPIIASACWMRGVVVLAFNIYSCKIVNDIRTKMKKKFYMTHNISRARGPFPNAKHEQALEPGTLYFRAGEQKPYHY